MILLRSLLYYAALTGTILAFGIPIVLLGGLLPQRFTDSLATRWGRLNLWLQRTICGLGYRLEGEDNIPSGPCIVMSKHQSAWETIGLRGILDPKQSWVLKEELTKIPIFGWGLRYAGSIPIDRSAGRRAVLEIIELGSRCLAEGRTVVIFPEGTRTAPGQRKKYGIGGGLLAARTGAAVIPIAHNAGVYWSRRGVKKYPGTVRIVIGPAIPTEGQKADEIMQQVEDWIEEKQLTLPITWSKVEVGTH